MDVGANVGDISRAAHAKGAIVHCIEPNPWAMETLKQAVPEGHDVFIHDFAASVLDGTQHLFFHENHEADPKRFSSGSSLIASKPNVSRAGLTVPSRDLSRFLADLGQVDFLKIDIEGYEVELVPHLVQTLDWELIGFVAVETHDREKWPDLKDPTLLMKMSVEKAGLSDKFSWGWP